ncbi:MAG: CHAT domain-containing protein, partial [bacterium]|nr:CHAT domain-containing protein [bacterium]
EADFDAQLQVARVLANKGQYAAAAISAERAHAPAMREADAKRRIAAARTLALLRLQVGDFAGAAASAREADRVAEREGDVATQIAMARLFAQVRYLDLASERLAALADAVDGDAILGAELAEARGDLALKLGAPGRARAELETALEGHREHYGARHPSTASVLQLRSSAHRMAGDLPAAGRDLREVLSIREEVYGARHPQVARTRNALGVLSADLSDWSSADAEFSAALTSLGDELGKHHPEVVTVRANRVLVDWGRDESEVEAFHYAATLDALAKAYGEDHPVVSDARRNLARMQEKLGNPEAAEALLDAAMESQLRALGAAHPALGQTRIARGRFYARSGRLDEASRELDRATALLRSHYGDEHPLVARARSARSRVATARGQWKLAWSDASEAARVFDLYLQRSFEAMPDRQRVLLAADADEVVGALLSASRDDPRAAYAAMIPQRDSVLRSIAAGRARERHSSGRTPEALRQMRARYVAAVLSEAPDAARRSRELAQAIDTEESVLALTRGRARERDPSEIVHSACRNLPRDAALVEFVVYDRVRAGKGVDPVPSYLAMIVRPRAADGPRECRVERVELGPASAIDQAADRFARAMRDQRGDAPQARVELARLLLAPLRAALEGSARWLWVPDGSLWGVPLAALPDPQDPQRYLVERVTAGSLTSIHELAHYGEGEDILGMRALLFGAPDFGSQAQGGGPMVLTAAGPCRLPPFEPLPGTVQELEEIRGLLPSAEVVVGSEAAKSSLYSALDARPAIVHLATHAYFAGGAGCEGTVAPRADEPRAASLPVVPNPLLLSGIVLAGANDAKPVGADAREEEASGILTALEAAGLDLSASRLVVLSACDTGTGLHRRGQEVQGLRWGFRAAGAKSLVTSLWRSNDVVTRKLMVSFYRQLVSKTHRGDLFEGPESLRSAQLARISSEARLGLKKPLTWANFVFSGLY